VLSIGLLLAAAALLGLAFAEKALRALPLTPALLYLGLGAAAGAIFGAPSAQTIAVQAPLLRIVLELALLVSLFAIGLRLRIAPTWQGWRVALLLAGQGMVVTIAVTATVGVLLFGWSWGTAVVVASILAPTDPVLASEVQVHSADDRDTLRLSLTAEGAMNDGSALPSVVLGLWLMQSERGSAATPGWWSELLWPVVGGAVIGVALGYGLGLAIRARVRAGDALVRDELLLLGGVTLAYGVALVTATSAFVLGFALAVTLLQPLRGDAGTPSEAPLAERLHAFGARIERLVEAFSVIAIGIGLFVVPPTASMLLLALALVLVARPLAVFAVVPPRSVSSHQRRLLAWFGIRGVGSLYYAAYAIERGLQGDAMAQMLGVVMTALAASIVLHGLSVTQLMQAYQRRRGH
jgi:sodium/hydrogen antiporter